MNLTVDLVWKSGHKRLYGASIIDKFIGQRPVTRTGRELVNSMGDGTVLVNYFLSMEFSLPLVTNKEI
jgi:hypothetical protein